MADAKPSFAALIYHGRDTGAYEIEASDMDAYVAERISQIQRRRLRLRVTCAAPTARCCGCNAPCCPTAAA